jgi:PAS domain S-box-containing protein
MTRITGFPVDEVLGHTAFEFIHPEDIALAHEPLQELLSEPGKSIVLIQRILKKDGSYVWCEGLLINLLNNPVVQGIVSNFRDISERREHEDVLTKNNADLKKTNMELDKFVYSTSHDLRAPLSSMLGIIELSLEEKLKPKLLMHLNMLKESIEKLDNFIGDILDYSRNARLHVDKEEIDFQELIDDVTGNLKYMGDVHRQTQIAIDITQDIPFLSDKYRLTVILNNLISNAFRYQNVKAQSPLVNIFVDASKNEAIIKVQDNGIGISKEFHDKIFDMFYRISSESNGSGLGLYIVKETVDKLRGCIELQSEPGKGSTFSIHIPNNLIMETPYAPSEN